jgi:hypothetical protein
MKHKVAILSLFIALVCSNVFGQMSKEEAKVWKTKMKELDVESYKKLVEDKESAEANVQSLTSDNQTLLTEVSSLKAQNAKLESDVEDYQRAAKEAADKLAAEKLKQDSSATASGTTSNTYGLYTRSAKSDLVYKVQIGAFKKFDITKYFNNHQNFSGEVDDDGTMKYTLGEFPDYWEADKFKSFLREMGVNGAWVVAYKNGKRVNMKDAREGAL